MRQAYFPILAQPLADYSAELRVNFLISGIPSCLTGDMAMMMVPVSDVFSKKIHINMYVKYLA